MSSDPIPQAREAEVRDRIFASALRHFSQKGYAATSLREVSEDAQTRPISSARKRAHGSIIRQILEEMADAIRSCEASPQEQVIAYCERYMEHFLAQEEIIALVLREVFGLGGASMATFSQTLGQRVRQPLDDIVAHGMEMGAFKRDHVTTCSSAITGILNMFILAHFGGQRSTAGARRRSVLHFWTEQLKASSTLSLSPDWPTSRRGVSWPRATLSITTPS
jgi:AcrR family transcriptional regulator